MRTILVEIGRFIHGQDEIVRLVYRGSGWKANGDVGGYAILEIYRDLDIIATHKSWDNVKFADELVSETIL